MRVKIEYGCRVRETDVLKTEVVETDNFRTLYHKLKREFIKEHKIDDIDYLNDFSEIDEEEEGAFYIGFEEGEYVEGWKLI